MQLLFVDDQLTSEHVRENSDLIRSYIESYFKYFLELENVDITKSPVIYSMIDILSKFTEKQLFYSLSVYKEFFLTKARLPESIYNLAAFVGYTPKEATPSECEIDFAIRLDFYSSKVVIPISRGFSLLGARSVPFQLQKDIRIEVEDNRFVSIEEIDPETGTSYKIPYYLDTTSDVSPNLFFSTQARQVEEATHIFGIPSDVKPYQFITIDVPVKEQIFKVKVEVLEVGGSEWKEYKKYDSLFLLLSGDEGFVYKKITQEQGANKFIRIFFGNNLMGKQPQPGSKVRVTVLETMGSKGNVPSYSIHSVSSITIQDGGGGGEGLVRSLSYKCFNPFPSQGGRDEEMLEEIRENSLKYISALRKLVSENDYKNLPLVDPVNMLTLSRAVPVLKQSDPSINDIQEYIVSETSTYDPSTGARNIELVPARTEVMDFYAALIPEQTSSSQSLEDKIQGWGRVEALERDFPPRNTVSVSEDLYLNLFPMKVDVSRMLANYMFFNDNCRCSPKVLFKNEDYSIQVTSAVLFLDDSLWVPRLRLNFVLGKNFPSSRNLYCDAYAVEELPGTKMVLQRAGEDCFEYMFPSTFSVPCDSRGNVNLRINLYIGDSTGSSLILVQSLDAKFAFRTDLGNFMNSRFDLYTSSRLGFFFRGVFVGKNGTFNETLDFSYLGNSSLVTYVPRNWYRKLQQARLYLDFIRKISEEQLQPKLRQDEESTARTLTLRIRGELVDDAEHFLIPYTQFIRRSLRSSLTNLEKKLKISFLPDSTSLSTYVDVTDIINELVLNVYSTKDQQLNPFYSRASRWRTHCIVFFVDVVEEETNCFLYLDPSKLPVLRVWYMTDPSTVKTLDYRAECLCLWDVLFTTSTYAFFTQRADLAGIGLRKFFK